MGTLMWGLAADTGELAPGSTVIYQPFKTNDDVILLALRHWIIFYNNPSITGMSCSIYADDFSSGVHLPSTLIATATNTWEKSDIITLANGFYEIYYDFAKIPLQGDSWYHAVFNAATYAPAGGAHVSYRLGYPDPVYKLNLTIEPTKILVFPKALYHIGASF